MDGEFGDCLLHNLPATAVGVQWGGIQQNDDRLANEFLPFYNTIMSCSSSLPTRIEINALWTGFASPQTSGRLVLRQEEDGDWTSHDEVTLSLSTVTQGQITRFLNAIDDIATEPAPIRFGRTTAELDYHFGSRRTNDSPTMLIELHNNDHDLRRIRTTSNHAHLLPWTIEGEDGSDNFNPEISIAIAAILPDGWMFKERLQSSSRIFDTENEIRAEFEKQEQEQVPDDRPTETYEQQMAKFNEAMNQLADATIHGEETEFVKEKRDYTANQLRRLSATELSELVAAGFDLSTSDETGQTALMMAASPPFNREQFEKLIFAGADVNAKRADSMTGIMQACAGGMEKTVPFWINAGADISLRGPHGCTALMLGAKNSEIVRSLLKYGADATYKDNDGDTALDYAMDELDIMSAGKRLQSIDLLAREIGRVDLPSLKRSLDRAIEASRITRVHNQVLSSLGRRPMSENIFEGRKKADQSEAIRKHYAGMDEFIDLEITEIELADRIVAVLREVVAEFGASSNG